jgi:L-lactate dehydrogenase complex protein LldG
MSTSREKIIARIGEALASPAPRHHESVETEARRGGATADFREWLPRAGTSDEEQRALFKRQCALLRAEVVECDDSAAAAAHLLERARNNHWKRIAYHSGKLIEPLIGSLSSSLETVSVSGGYQKGALEQCDAGVTECESLVAQTGSICVTAGSSGGRALSVLPPEHIVIASWRQLVPDLSAAFEHLAAKYQHGYPSFVSFISGPSRTGDIERILVLGAHGPRKLTICLLAE